MKRIVLAAALVTALAAALPALAATPVYKGTVGPGFTITMASKPTKAGKVTIVVADKSSIHNFHLTGPGVNVKTSVSAHRDEDVHRDPQEGHVQVHLRPAPPS